MWSPMEDVFSLIRKAVVQFSRCPADPALKLWCLQHLLHLQDHQYILSEFASAWYCTSRPRVVFHESSSNSMAPMPDVAETNPQVAGKRTSDGTVLAQRTRHLPVCYSPPLSICQLTQSSSLSRIALVVLFLIGNRALLKRGDPTLVSCPRAATGAKEMRRLNLGIKAFCWDPVLGQVLAALLPFYR